MSNLKFIVVFTMLSIQAGAQVGQDSTGMVWSTPDYAKNIEYWGQKGISSSVGIKLMESRIQSLEGQVSLTELVNRNALAQAEQYRKQLQANADISYQLQKDLYATREDRDAWKLKAKTRGLILWGGAAILGVAGFFALTN